MIIVYNCFKFPFFIRFYLYIFSLLYMCAGVCAGEKGTHVSAFKAHRATQPTALNNTID